MGGGGSGFDFDLVVTPPRPQFNTGQEVLVVGEGGLYYPTTVTKVNADGTFGIKYTNAWGIDTKESHVFAKDLRVRLRVEQGLRALYVCVTCG